MIRTTSRLVLTLARRLRALLPLAILQLSSGLLRAAQPATSVWSFSDLDGDLRPDSIGSKASAPDRLGYVYTVEFSMSAGKTSFPIQIHSQDAGGLHIAQRDVDGDHDLDLVVTGGSRQPLGVWVNDGNGGC